MNILDRHYLGRLLTMFVRTLLVLVALYVFIDLMTNRREDIIEHDVPWNAVVQYYLCSIPVVVNEYQVAALSMLISALLVYGSAAQHNEVTSMLAGGVGKNRIGRVPFAMGLGIALCVFIGEEAVGPAAATRAQEIHDRYFSRIGGSGRSGISWAHLSDNWKCHVRKFNRIALTGEDVLLLAAHDTSEEQIRARRIFWDGEREAWILEDGTWSTFYLESGMEVETRRITQEPAPISVSPDRLFALDKPSNTKRLRRLAQDIQYAEGLGMPSTRMKVDWHSKFARPFLCIAMVGIAMPFSIRIRRGGLAIGLGVSIGVALCYLVVFSISQTLGYMDRLSPLVAAWLANALFGAAGIVLYRLTPT